MKHWYIVFLFILLLLLPSGYSFAEERNIYVGDLIELKISTTAFSEEEIAGKFNGFEIVAMEKQPDGFLLTLRTFETGEKKITLGDKEIVIHVQSTLDNIERNDVFEGSIEVQDAGFLPDWRIPAGLAALLFILSGGFTAVKLLQNRKLARLSPKERFMKAISRVSLDDREALVYLTLCLKMYLETRFSLRIRGKTSGEILQELSPIPELQPGLPEIGDWLEKCDYLKFSGSKASQDQKQELCSSLKALVEDMETIKEGNP